MCKCIKVLVIFTDQSIVGVIFCVVVGQANCEIIALRKVVRH